MTIELTPEDVKNGWSLEAKRAYHAEREAAAAVNAHLQGRVVGGNIVTEFVRSYRPPIRHESALNYNPHKFARRH